MGIMTMTYTYRIGDVSSDVVKSTIIQQINVYGAGQGINRLYEDNDSLYCTDSNTMLRIRDNGELEISQEKGDKKKIDETKSKLLKIVKKLQLN